MDRGLRLVPDAGARAMPNGGPNAFPTPELEIDQAIAIRNAIADSLFEEE